MSINRDSNSKQRRNDSNILKNLPTEVLLKARNTLVSLSGALRPKQDQQQQKVKITKQESGENNIDKLKTSRSDPEFGQVWRNKHRSRTDERAQRENRPRPMSLGPTRRYDRSTIDRDVSISRQYDSTEDVCVQSRLVIPVGDRINNVDVRLPEMTEKPRKKLSFREPEIVGSMSATLGRSHKIMGINHLSRRPNRLSRRFESHYSSLDGADSDLESQAMRIVRTVGQAFEVCHKMQNGPEQAAPSTSTTGDEVTDRASEPASKVAMPETMSHGLHSTVSVNPAEAASDCGASESGAASTSRVAEERPPEPARPTHLELLPPPPRKQGKRSPQCTPAPSINLPELPECVTKVETSVTADGDASTPLSAQHQLQLLRERLEQQAQQTRAAVAQLLLLRDQLAAEQAARCEAQARTHQLLVHNKELLEHIAALVAHLQERERGGSRPISAQQLTLLPQAARGASDVTHSEAVHCNGNNQEINTETLIHLLGQNNKFSPNLENNNTRLSPYSISPNIPGSPCNGPDSPPFFAGMTNEQIQKYLISKFQNINVINGTLETNGNTNTVSSQQYYQNSNAFPNIPPLTNHFSSTDLASLLEHSAYKNLTTAEESGSMTQAMSVGHSQNSLCSNSQATTSKDSSPEAISSDDGVHFIMPLSHNGTLAATGQDGRVRLIVPVSPSASASDVAGAGPGHQAGASRKGASDVTLQLPSGLLTPAGPITRSTSEKVPNRSEMMAAMRSQWTRHTTK